MPFSKKKNEFHPCLSPKKEFHPCLSPKKNNPIHAFLQKKKIPSMPLSTKKRRNSIHAFLQKKKDQSILAFLQKTIQIHPCFSPKSFPIFFFVQPRAIPLTLIFSDYVFFVGARHHPCPILSVSIFLLRSTQQSALTLIFSDYFFSLGIATHHPRQLEFPFFFFVQPSNPVKADIFGFFFRQPPTQHPRWRRCFFLLSGNPQVATPLSAVFLDFFFEFSFQRFSIVTLTVVRLS